jgi:hypothetical protein
LSLHFTGSSFVITRLLDRGVTAARRQAIALGVLLGVILIVVVLVQRSVHASPPGELDTLGALLAYAGRIASTGPLHWLLQPAGWLLAPLFASEAKDFLLALMPAALIYAAHYVWVLRAQTPFEEASLALAGRRAARLAAARAGKFTTRSARATGRIAPFALARALRPELAFLWKNLLASASYLRLRTLLIVAMAVAIVGMWPAAGPALKALRAVVGGTALSVGLLLLVFGPQMARQDLRSDLANTDILKSYPLHGWQIVLGELLTPLVVLTAALWLALLTGWMTLLPPTRIAAGLWLPALIGLALLAPLLMAVQLVVANATAVLFPAWIQLAQQPRSAGMGIELVGQRMIFVAGQMLILLLSLVPPALVGLALFFVARLLTGTTAASVLALAAVLGVLGTEVWVGIRMLGEKFDDFDLSAELKP